uniref:Zinc transporter 2 n=1 Tax=Steinernema glaseri TaxID=37863 RepID=A0A1I7YH20_9BILA
MMLITAGIGVIFNIVMGLVLHFGKAGHSHFGISHSHDSDDHSHDHGHQHGHSHSNINVRAAFIHVIGDLVQSVGVLIAAVIIKFTKWEMADPLCTFLFSVLVLLTTTTVLRDTLGVIMEATPRHIKLENVENDLMQIKGVQGVHSLRIWSLTLDKTACSVHLDTADSAVANTVVLEANRVLKMNYGVKFITVQLGRIAKVGHNNFTQILFYTLLCRAEKCLIFVSFLTVFFIACELVGGYIAHSIAIMTDAFHMISDLTSFIVSLIAIRLAKRAPSSKHSYGLLRAEILGALMSILIIWVLTGILLYMAIIRVVRNDLEVDADMMLITAGIGVIFNIVMGLVLHFGKAGHSHFGISHSHDSVSPVLQQAEQSVGLLQEGRSGAAEASSLRSRGKAITFFFNTGSLRVVSFSSRRDRRPPLGALVASVFSTEKSMTKHSTRVCSSVDPIQSHSF